MLAGPITASDVALAEVMVKAAVFEVIEPEVAVILAVPAATPRASPLVGAVSLTLATVLAEELQLTLPVMTCVVPSL